MIRTIIKITVPVLILILAVGVFRWQMSNRPEPKKKESKKIVPIVRTVDAELVRGYRYQVRGYGNIQPAKQVEIVSEVAGKVIWMNEKMKSGGMFRKNEGLYRVDDTEYRAELDSKISALKDAEYQLKTIEEEARISLKEWEIWNETAGEVKKPGALISYGPQLEAAAAAVEAARSAVVSAETDLAKIMYKAPFDSVVTAETIEHGKIIRVGESAGTLVGSECYEVYMPVSAKDAVRLTFSAERQKSSSGYIELAEGKNSWKWPAYAERVLPDADSKTGMLQAVLAVPGPFDTKNGERPVLPIGASVKAVLNDNSSSDMIRIPDEALREGNVIWVLIDGKIQIRDIGIQETRGDYIYINRGLLEGEKVITSDLQGVVDGMAVNGQAPQQRGNSGGDK